MSPTNEMLRPSITETADPLDAGLPHRFSTVAESPPDADAAAVNLLREARTEADAAEYFRLILEARSGRPLWLPGTQELWWKGRVVKCFRFDAENQTAVLAAFQRAGWPDSITDPLPAVPGRNAKSCRRQTVKSLKKRLMPGTIRFRLLGTVRIRREVVA